MSTTLPSLPPRLAAATLAAADNLAAIAAAEGVPLVGERSEALPHLVTILYTIRERCVQAQAMPEPAGPAIEPGEIAAVLETIAEMMVSDGMREMAGMNASWYKDAARIVEMMGSGRAWPMRRTRYKRRND